MPRTLISIALAMTLAACAIKYVEPATGDRAQIEFSSETTESIVYFYDDPTRCRNRRTLYPVIIAVGERRAVTVPAGSDLAFSVSHSVSQRGAVGGTAVNFCIPTVVFRPAPSHRYKFVYGGAPGGCRSALLDVTDSTPVRVPHVSREWTRGFDESGPWCTDEGS